MKKINTLLIMLLAIFGGVKVANSQTVGFYVGYDDPENDIDNNNLYGSYLWFVQNYVGEGKNGVIITPSTIDKIDELSTLWIAYDEDKIDKGWEELPASYVGSKTLDKITNFVKDGGSLYLTCFASQMVVAIDRVDRTYTPNYFNSTVGKSNNDTWGVNAYIGANPDMNEHYDHNAHAVFNGLETLVYEAKDVDNSVLFSYNYYPLIDAPYKADHNCIWDFNYIDGLEENPNKVADFETKTNSTVLGTWEHVSDFAVGGIVEFKPTADFKGTVLCNGIAAYDFTLLGSEEVEKNTYMESIYKLTANSIEYLRSVSKKNNDFDGINEVNADNAANDAIYNLQGMKVAKATKGLYIQNGKKFAVK